MEKNPNHVKSIKDVIAHWEEDSKEIDINEPHKAASILNKLHQKYLTIRANHSLMVKKMKVDLKEEKNFRFRLYNGKVSDPEELKEHGAVQFNEKILKSDVPMYVEADKRVTDLELKIGYHEEIVDYCTHVIKAISDRNWHIRHIVEWEKLVTGG